MLVWEIYSLNWRDNLKKILFFLTSKLLLIKFNSVKILSIEHTYFTTY